MKMVLMNGRKKLSMEHDMPQEDSGKHIEELIPLFDLAIKKEWSTIKQPVRIQERNITIQAFEIMSKNIRNAFNAVNGCGGKFADEAIVELVRDCLENKQISIG